ncbi:MAG TPA: nicotinamide-nucleotide amidohydrolase family protein [Steroidobacteraceae bacterium]
MNDIALSRLAARVGAQLRGAGLRVVTAESCTAGWIAKALTDVAGSSVWLDSGYVTYSNEAKVRALGVSPRTLDHFGAVSRETVREMARGALRASGVEVAVAVSGIAGPDGGTPGKPVGTVWFCTARRRGARTEFATLRERFGGSRETVRRKSVERAMRLIARLLAPPPRRARR